MSKFLSIIIPVYNDREHLGNALYSILTQDEPINDIEIIIVDDCSNCDYDDIIAEYGTKGLEIKYIRNEVNVGAGVARENGIEVAQGEYISFLDSDDCFCYDMLTELKAAIKKYPDKEVFHWGSYDGASHMVQFFCFYCGGMALKKSFIEQYGIHFHPEIRLWEDVYYNYLVCLIAFYYNKHVHIARVLHCYLNNKKSTVNTVMIKLNETEKSVRAMYAYMASVTWVLNHYPEITDKLEVLLKMIEELKDAKVRLGKEDDEENKSERQFGEKYFTLEKDGTIILKDC